MKDEAENGSLHPSSFILHPFFCRSDAEMIVVSRPAQGAPSGVALKQG
jgi:hypothetical protein